MKLPSVGKLKAHPNGSGNGVVRNMVTTAEYAGASYLFGYVQNAYPQHARVHGVPVDLAAGVAAKAASFLLTMMGVSGKVGSARSHLDVVGNAGIGAYFHTLGSGHGFNKSGRVRAVLPAGSVGKLNKAVPEATILGVSARAPKGDLLTASDLMSLAR